MSEAAVAGGESWSELLALTASEASPPALVQRLLAICCAARAAAGAALYLEEEGSYERELEVGAGGFPRELDLRVDLPLDLGRAGFTMLDLPEARVLFCGGAEDPASPASAGSVLPVVPVGPEVVALASAARVLRLRRELRRQSFEVNYRGVELEALYDVGLAIASTLNLEDLGQEILLRAVSLLDARRGALFLAGGDGFGLEGTIGGDACPWLARSDPAVGALRRGQEPVEQSVLPGARHLLAVPIAVQGREMGLLVVADKESRRGVGPFAAADRRTLALFANQAAIALENARLHRQALEKERLEREMQLAAEIQRQLLPDRVPLLAGVEIVGWTRPARHIGGDYYDFIPLGDVMTAVLGDVSGKGMPAALMVSTLHSSLRLLVEQLGPGPALLERLNHHLFASSAPNKFVTLALAVIGGEDSLSYLCAGHNPALWVGTGGEVRHVEGGGLPLGLFSEATYEAKEVKLEPGELLCLYSDGITECASPSEEEFGVGRLGELLREGRRDPLPELISRVEQATAVFARGLPQADDQTLVLLRRVAA